MSSIDPYEDTMNNPEFRLRMFKNMLKDSIQCDGYFERYRDGSRMAQSMQVSDEAPLKDILKSASQLAKQNFPYFDKFELKMHLTSDQMRVLSELLE